MCYDKYSSERQRLLTEWKAVASHIRPCEQDEKCPSAKGRPAFGEARPKTSRTKPRKQFHNRCKSEVKKPDVAA